MRGPTIPAIKKVALGQADPSTIRINIREFNLDGIRMGGDMEVDSPLSNPFYWLYCAGGVALFGWLAGETFVSYAGAKRRWQLGLCTRMVCNRYLLLGLAASLWVSVAVLSASDYVVFALTESWYSPINYLLGAAEFTSIVMIWLAFVPPTFYQHWIDGTAPVAKAVEG